MWHKSRIKSVLGVMAVVFFLMAGVGYVQAAEKVEIHILGLFDLTGPYSAQHQLQLTGAKAGEAFVNETEYIPGVKLVHDVYDHGTDVSKGVLAFQMAIGKKPKPVVSTAGTNSSIGLALKPLAERNRIPMIDFIPSRSVLTPPGWIFSINAQSEGLFGASANWLKANWKADSEVEWIRKHYQDRPPRISILGWDNPWGRSCDQPEARAYIKKIGVDLVQPEYVPVTPTDTSAELLRLKKAGVDLIYVPMYHSAHFVVLKDAERLGIRNDFIWVGQWGYMLNDSIKLMGPLAENLTMLTGVNPLMEEWPRYFREAFPKAGLRLEHIEGYAMEIAHWDVFSEAIRRAIKAVGSPEKIDGEAVYNAIITLKDFRPMGYTSKINYSKTKIAGADTADLYQVKNAKVVRIAKDIPLPDLFPGGKDVPK